MGDSTRLRVISRLSTEGPLCIARLSDAAPISRQAVTKHLQVLADAGLVRGRRCGRERIWELEPSQLETARRYLDEVSQRWDSAIDRLRDFVEE